MQLLKQQTANSDKTGLSTIVRLYLETEKTEFETIYSVTIQEQNSPEDGVDIRFDLESANELFDAFIEFYYSGSTMRF